MTELEELREFKRRTEIRDADYANPNVLLIEGELNRYDGEFFATGVSTKSGHVYLARALEELMEWKGEIKTFAWHISSEPLSFWELEESLARVAMGLCNTEFNHAYSDLTGYLWTNEKIEIGGHDVLEEINQTANAMTGKKYIALRVERKAEDDQ